MRHRTSNTRVLLASDNTNDVQQIQRQLSGNFTQVKVSTDAERCLQEFERHSPEVLVLAFDRLDKAQRYYLGLYRLGSALLQHPHRTVMLCRKDQVHAVFELCKQAHLAWARRRKPDTDTGAPRTGFAGGRCAAAEARSRPPGGDGAAALVLLERQRLDSVVSFTHRLNASPH